MKIVVDFPPNWEEILKVFPQQAMAPVVITYGDTIYNPRNTPLRPDLIHHEEVHMMQQGDDPEGYSKKYLSDPKFRVEMELQAYGAQLRFIRKERGEPDALKALKSFAKFMSSEVYGNIISFEQAAYKISSLSRNARNG